jgi:vancomycin resistance protein VanW
MTLTTRIRAGLRRHLPEPLRRFVAQARRRFDDARGRAGPFVYKSEISTDADRGGLVCAVEIVQPIRRTAHFEGKMHNIELAVARLSGMMLSEHEAVSFWRTIGMPTARHGFQLGRGIVGDRLTADVGGGLCQIASLLYELGLRGGLTVIERHPHSRDLYTEDNRFTPLGLDATVVWGFKDVRLGNPYPHPVAFVFAVKGETLRGRLLSAQPIAPLELELSRRDEGRQRFAEVLARGGDGKTVTVSSDAYIIDPS